MNSSWYKTPPSILASYLVNTAGFNGFIIVVLVVNAVIIGVDVECTLHWPHSMNWLHLTVDIVSVVGRLPCDGSDINDCIGGSRIFRGGGVTLGTRASEALWWSGLTGVMASPGFDSRRGTKRHRNKLSHAHNNNMK